MTRLFRSLGYALSILAACLMISAPAIAGSGSANSAFDVFKKPLPSLDEIRNSKRAEAVKRALNPLKDRIDRLDKFTQFAEEGVSPLLDKLLRKQAILTLVGGLINPLIDAIYGRFRKVVVELATLGGAAAVGSLGTVFGGIISHDDPLFWRLFAKIVFGAGGAWSGAIIGQLIGEGILPRYINLPEDPLDVDTHDQSFFLDEMKRLGIELPTLPRNTPDSLRQNAQDYLQLYRLWQTYHSPSYSGRPEDAKLAKLQDLLATREQDLCWQITNRNMDPRDLIDINRINDPRVSDYMYYLVDLHCEVTRPDCTLCTTDQ